MQKSRPIPTLASTFYARTGRLVGGL
jgi:hypothetical protein